VQARCRRAGVKQSAPRHSEAAPTTTPEGNARIVAGLINSFGISDDLHLSDASGD
jgi:hypothetical protein